MTGLSESGGNDFYRDAEALVAADIGGSGLAFSVVFIVLYCRNSGCFLILDDIVYPPYSSYLDQFSRGIN